MLAMEFKDNPSEELLMQIHKHQ
eukprot:COSAG03_NODE_25464_length_265_cov_0.927711_1_plen_22_part_01